MEQEIDLHGNTVDYSYTHDTGSGGEPWTQVYPAAITYTGVNGSGGFYEVRFFLDDGEQRPDRFSSGRQGFKVLTRRRLAQVDVLAGGDLVRRYLFAYREGDFRKSLLESVAVTGEDGASELARHEFQYQPATAAFSATETWSGLGGAKDCSASFNVSGGVHVHAGLGPPACMPLGGIQVGGSAGGTTELASFLDVNGDGFPDLVGADGGFHTRLNNGTSFLPVSLNGAIQKKQTGGDGVKVEIFHNDSRIWQRTFAAGDVAPCVPASGDVCGAGLSLDVQAGDRIYFLASSIRETSADALLWAPRVTYTGEDEEALEPWGSRVTTPFMSGLSPRTRPAASKRSRPFRWAMTLQRPGRPRPSRAGAPRRQGPRDRLALHRQQQRRVDLYLRRRGQSGLRDRSLGLHLDLHLGSHGPDLPRPGERLLRLHQPLRLEPEARQGRRDDRQE